MSRCVICGRTKDLHAPDGTCAGSAGVAGKKYASMDLPDGVKCDDCGHFRFCLQFIGEDIRGNTTCDWYPIRFVPKVA